MLHRQGTHAVIHCAISAQQNRKAAHNGIGQHHSTMSLASMAETDTFIDSIRPLPGYEEMHDAWEQEVRFQRCSLPVWEGRLKQKKSKLFGGDTWRDRHVRLDPEAGLLSIWSVQEGQDVSASPSGPPKKEFDLRCIRGVDSNRHHLDIMILLSDKVEQEKVKYALQLRAPTTSDYTNWMFVLGHFGMRHDIMGVDVKLRGQLTRAFTSMTLNQATQYHCARDCAEDECSSDETTSQHSTSASESTNCSVQTIDDEVLSKLSLALEDVSPCNKEWRRQVGIEEVTKLPCEILQYVSL
jgi:hypothetical protein